MKRIFQITSLVIVFFIIAIFASNSRGQMAHNDSVVPYKSITSQVESTIERTKVRAIMHISQARSDIHRKNWARAKIELSEASRLMESIRDDLSTLPAKSLIRIARKHLEYEQAQQVLHDFPRIYSSLEKVSVYLPIDKTKMRIDRAKVYLENNNKQEADRELALADKSLIVIEVELPLLRSQQYVSKAQRYLAAKNATKAEEALQVAENRAIAINTLVNSPLFEAKQNIWMAFRNYFTAKRADAGTYLKQAREHLSKAAAGGSTKVKEEADKLSSELVDLEKKLGSEGKVSESALKAAWEKSAALAERSVAYLSAGLSEEETTLGEESNLIEARLHVTYAETYQITTSEPDKATRELDTAYSYLQKAAGSSLAGPTDRKKIREIDTIILALKANPEKSDAVVQERYDKINEELRDLKSKEELVDLNQKIR